MEGRHHVFCNRVEHSILMVFVCAHRFMLDGSRHRTLFILHKWYSHPFPCPIVVVDLTVFNSLSIAVLDANTTVMTWVAVAANAYLNCWAICPSRTVGAVKIGEPLSFTTTDRPVVGFSVN